VAIHAYRTTLLSDDGSFGAEVISFPRYFEDHPAGLAQLERLGEELGAERGAPVTAETLPYMLEPIAYDTRGLGPRSALAVPQVIDEVFQEPIVIVEESPPFGTSLLTLLSQGATGYVWIIEGRPLLAVAGDLAFVVVWFALGPIKGVRRGLEEAAYEATKEVATEQLKRWLRRRFPSRRSK
jgi:hypothetical protein